VGSITRCGPLVALQGYSPMTVLWMIILIWLALQLPLAVLIGKSIRFGMSGPQKASPGSYVNLPAGVVWC
jgi:hypothetical protein